MSIETDVAAVLADYPLLVSSGFAKTGEETWFANKRQTLAESFVEVMAAKAWLEAGAPGAKTWRDGSYTAFQMARNFQRFADGKLLTGAIIVAAILLGWNVEEVTEPKDVIRMEPPGWTPTYRDRFDAGFDFRAFVARLQEEVTA